MIRAYNQLQQKGKKIHYKIVRTIKKIEKKRSKLTRLDKDLNKNVKEFTCSSETDVPRDYENNHSSR